MFLEDAPKFVGIEIAVPNSVRINDEPGTRFADTQAGGLGSKHGDRKFPRFALEDIPEGVTLSGVAAIRAGAKEEVPGGAGNFLERDFRVGRKETRFAHGRPNGNS